MECIRRSTVRPIARFHGTSKNSNRMPASSPQTRTPDHRARHTTIDIHRNAAKFFGMLT